MRYASEDARISVKEIDLGLTADVGVLQRLPRVIGEGMARELAYTARELSGREAREIGLVNRCFGTREELLEGVTKIARTMADTSLGMKEGFQSAQRKPGFRCIRSLKSCVNQRVARFVWVPERLDEAPRKLTDNVAGRD
jgi:enoyl-CoA hydratase/carnithine racemase